MNSTYKDQVKRRRTFGIISHPDAGKTTLTEKLLLFGGAIQQAGAVKARKAERHATSDWMSIEKERGISVTTSVMKFNYRGLSINLLDTPGHQDFSEDTYRVLTAVDSALMVIDSAKGVEPQTKKLMEVCRMRNTPIITFINKLDRVGMSPLDILDTSQSRASSEKPSLVSISTSTGALKWSPTRSSHHWLSAGVIAMRRRHSGAATEPESTPPKMTCPSCGSKSIKERSRSVLPPPDSPLTQTVSPGANDKLIGPRL